VCGTSPTRVGECFLWSGREQSLERGDDLEQARTAPQPTLYALPATAVAERRREQVGDTTLSM